MLMMVNGSVHNFTLLSAHFQGSAFRCLKTGEPIDVVLEIAARESGVPIGDILENLPAELSVWVDPGEVSYRIGEKGAVKVSALVLGFMPRA
jgi:Flp pilus assembly protein TadB